MEKVARDWSNKFFVNVIVTCRRNVTPPKASNKDTSSLPKAHTPTYL